MDLAQQFKFLLKETAAKWLKDNCVRLGASLSYYTLFSLFPLILVILFITRLLLINSEIARSAILDGLASITGGFRDEFVTALEAVAQTRGSSGFLGTFLLIFGASWVFGELVSAFNIIWGVEAPWRGGPLEFLRLTFFSYALILVSAFLLLVSLIISALLTLLGQFLVTLPGGAVLWGSVQMVINLSVLTFIFALLFKYLPQTHVEWRDVWAGAVLTAIMWSLAQWGISYYIAWSSYKDYGPVGAILALITWVYLSSLIVFAGGEFSAVFARHYGSRSSRGGSSQ
ncbi:MAG: YihY/virulence factor BrkB family protein [Anaerolineae bacterium]|nr:YihY/virulence factor BrkB family protein [Anaerolineae bacterium]